MVVTFYRRHSGFHSPNAFFVPKKELPLFSETTPFCGRRPKTSGFRWRVRAKPHVHPLRHAAFKTVDGAQNALNGSKVDVVFRTHAEDATAARHAQFDIGDGL